MSVPPFARTEYDDRVARTQARLEGAGHSHLLVADPASICYLTGFDACSFYAPQALIVPAQGDLTFFCRAIDTSSVVATTYLSASQVFGYPEPYVQNDQVDPMDWIAAELGPTLGPGAVLAVEADSPNYTVRSHRALVAGLGSGVTVVEVPSIVRWVRGVKSPAEIEAMRVAGAITERMFATAQEVIRPGVRQCDAVAEISATQIRGLDAAGGSYAAIPPLVLAGDSTAYPHVSWSDAPFKSQQAVALELSGVRHRYHAPVARTIYLGTPPPRLLELADVVGDGLDLALTTIRPGVTGETVATAWNSVIERHGLSKSSRIGYPVGLGYPPDWGEQTSSLRVGDHNVLVAGMTFHVMIGMWLDGWGYSTSETVVVTPGGAEPLTQVTRGLLVVDG